MKRLNLVLHCGASKAERADVEIVPTPEPTATWTPIPHATLLDEVERCLAINNLSVVEQAHGLTKGGMEYFGLMQVANGQNSEDYSWAVGLRNSHTKRFPASLVVGAGVFVCDNLSFSGEIRAVRKHTTHILRDLGGLIQRSIGRLMEKWHDQDRRIEAYKNANLGDVAAHDLVIRALDVRACTTTQVPRILNEWRNPKHDAFEPRTAWSLFNAFTEVHKGTSLIELQPRTERLHGLFDTHVGLPVTYGNN